MDTESNAKIAKALELFPIKPFFFERDARNMMSACSFAVIGSSKSGKSTALKYLLKTSFDDDIKVFFTQSPQSEIYASIKKETAFAPTYIPDIIRTCYNINKHTKNKYKFCIVVDDVTNVKADRQMTKLLCLYRNSNMSAIVCGQDSTMLSAVGRANVNSMLLFSLNTSNRIEQTVKDYLRCYLPKFLTMDEKIELFKIGTADHCFFFLDNLNGTLIRCKLQPHQILD